MTKEKNNEVLHVTCAVIVRNDRYLTVQRPDNKKHPGKWEFPGGKTEMGESPESCLVREIREELLMELHIIKALPEFRHPYPEGIVCLHPFICGPGTGNPTLTEHTHLLWVTPSESMSLDWLAADIPVRDLVNRMMQDGFVNGL